MFSYYKANTLFWPLEQKKGKLKSMEEQDDLDTELAKLVDQATNCNIQRFHNAIKIKVIYLRSLYCFLISCYLNLQGAGLVDRNRAYVYLMLGSGPLGRR